MQSLVSTRFKADLKGTVESGEDGGGRALDVVVEHEVVAAVPLQQVHRVLRREVLVLSVKLVDFKFNASNENLYLKISKMNLTMSKVNLKMYKMLLKMSKMNLNIKSVF